MTNFDKLIKERREQIIDILSKNTCFDSSGKTLIDYDYYLCRSCKIGDSENCEEEIKKWLCEEVEEKTL